MLTLKVIGIQSDLRLTVSYINTNRQCSDNLIIMSVMEYNDKNRRRVTIMCSCGRKTFASVTSAEYEGRTYIGRCLRCRRRGFMLILDGNTEA